MKTILVCGGRNYSDHVRVIDELDLAAADAGGYRSLHVVTGGAPGADSLAAMWARVNGCHTTTYPADWATHGPKAGPLRNQRMLDESRPVEVIAFPGGAGTADMVARARKAKVPVRVVKP